MGRAVHAAGLPCGLPSPGSRRQSVEPGRRPATVDDVRVAGPGEPFDCKLCRRSLRRRFKRQGGKAGAP